ncbi:MAG: branched-chain amino acid ABC transporter substrate-binding protein [Candidatus Eremiobacteraeota bacterium]|nr:branched-chain amino acid ABC transporter substrate-binding protein [Candidatus Eremiobacteraeota bacterium]
MSVHSRRRFLATGGAAGIAAAARPSLAQVLPRPPQQQFGREVVIGVCAPLSGDLAALGNQLANGARQAVYESNRLFGTLDRSFGLRTFDDQNTIVNGIMSAQFAGDDPSIVATVGHLNASVTKAALSQYANAKMPLIVPASSADIITSQGYRNVFRLPAKDSTEGSLFARFLVSSARPVRSLALTQDGDYGRDVARGFTQQMSAEKLPTDMITFAQHNPPFADVAQRVIDAKADFVFLAGNSETMGPLLAVLRGAGYKGKIGASQGFFNAQTAARYAADFAGGLISTSMPPLDRVQSVNDYLTDLRANYGEVTPVMAFGFAAAQIAVNAVRRTGAFDRLSLLRALTSGSYESLVGTFSFGFNGDPLDPNLYFYAIDGGRFKYVTSAHSSSFLISP